MFQLPGYDIGTMLYESPSSLVYRAVRVEDDRPAILKALRGGFPAPGDVARYRWEYEVLKKLGLNGVPTALSFVQADSRPVIVLEDIGGIDFDALFRSRTFTLAEKLALAVSAAEILESIHGAGVIHLDIKPSNIISNPDTRQVQIIDFGSSRSVSYRNSEVDLPFTFRGTPSYMSPEYTGRLNLAVDQRSDLYSFGVALYEFFTDRLPFETVDPLELMHSHIARIPAKPAEINPELPPVLSDLIMKLLAKAPQDRYQSARGVATDLKTCQDLLSREGKIISFPLARQDVSAHFEIPRNLIGRERERDVLLSLYKRAAEGDRQTVFIRGAAGVGKKSLMLNIQRDIAKAGGLFAYGAFDPFGGLGPLGAFISAMKELTLRLLSQGEASLAQWRERIQIALGTGCRVITDMIPETLQVLGEQPPVEDLEPAAARMRQQRVLRDLVRVLCRPEQPFVLCLDQVQGADPVALDFLFSLMTGDEIDFFQLICSVRTDGDASLDTWERFASRCRESDVNTAEITLEPLHRDQTTRMIAGVLHTGLEETAPLADLIWKKTAGNPFFIREFLGVLHDEKLISFDMSSGNWTWDLDGIREKGFTDNVVDLMVHGLEKLNHETQTALKAAAVMGTRFDVCMVAALSGVSEERILDVLAGAEDGGLIVKTVPKGDPVCSLYQYQFVHDRVRDAAYALIPSKEKAELHYRLGTYLQTLPEEEREHHIPDIADHLNLGADLVTEISERKRLAEINLNATRWSRNNARFRSAHRFARAGLALCEDDWWYTDYELLLALHLEAMESAYLAGNYEEMESLGRAAFAKAKTIQDQVRIFKIRVDANMVRNHWPEAVRIGLEALRVLGIPLDSAEGWSRENAGEKIKQLLAGRTIEDLRNLPPMQDPLSQLALRILTRAAAAFSSVTPELAPFLIHEQIRLCLEHGNAPESALSYMYLAVALCSAGDIETAYEFGRLAQDLAEQLGRKNQRVAVGFLFNFLIRHWKEHLGETIAPLLEVHQAGLESGELFSSTYALVYRAVHLFFMGRPLDEADRTFEECGRIVLRIGQRDAFNFVGIFRQAIANLRYGDERPGRLIGDYFDEDKMLAMESEADNRGRDYGLYFNKLLLSLLYGRYSETLENVERLTEMGVEFTSTATWPLYYFGEALARAALYRENEGVDGPYWLGRISACLDKLETWNRYAPMNVRQKYLLIKAEHARIRGQITEAAELYDQSISAAKENGYLSDEALANEITADFYLKRGKTTIGRSYLMEARYAYLRWGAMAKVADMEEKHPELLMGAMGPQPPGHMHLTLTSSTSTGSESSCGFDLASAFKAAQVVSSEIVLDKLLGKLMNIVMQNAGAEKAFLILDNDGRLVIRAKAWSDGRTDLPDPPTPLEESPELAPAIATYVARTRTPVVLDDAARKGRFKNEPYVTRNGIRSVICLPMINKNRLTGVLYLENNLSSGVFTSDHLESLGWLSSQAAISLENARLYQKLTDYSQWLENIISALNVAQEVQQGLLPWRAPKLAGVDIAGRSLYCDETGGDYYDYIQPAAGEPDRLAVVIGDVSGHGISAALLMSTTRAYLRSLAVGSKKPADVITGVNSLVSADARETGQFVTLFYLEIDAGQRKIAWVRAGQDPAILYSPADDTFTMLDGPGVALGVEEAWQYSQFTDEVEPGQVIVLATDGVWETRNDSGDMFGKQRLRDVIRANAGLSAEGIRQAVVDAVTDYRGRGPQQDDVTLVVIKFT